MATASDNKAVEGGKKLFCDEVATENTTGTIVEELAEISRE